MWTVGATLRGTALAVTRDVSEPHCRRWGCVLRRTINGTAVQPVHLEVNGKPVGPLPGPLPPVAPVAPASTAMAADNETCGEYCEKSEDCLSPLCKCFIDIRRCYRIGQPPTAIAAAPAASAPTTTAAQPVRVALHFESLCKQCQMHVQAMRDGVLRAGLELAPAAAGVRGAVALSVDFAGPAFASGTCEGHSAGTEHGPDMCVADRYHLCAQHPSADINQTASGWAWWDYSYCLYQNIDVLKCGNNGHCTESAGGAGDGARFAAALAAVHPMCAAFAGVNASAIEACASSDAARAMQRASFARTAAATQASGGTFAPALVNGVKPAGTDDFWRLMPNTTDWAAGILRAVCDAAAKPKPFGCVGIGA